MKTIGIAGWGAVSPAGWGMPAFRTALAAGSPIPAVPLKRPDGQPHGHALRVPSPSPRPICLAHPRLRRSGAITQFAVAAAVEALGPNPGPLDRLGIIAAVFSGSITYTRRFYEEVLKEPATASPLLFPETVFNAPASHLAAVLGATSVNYTLIGDTGTFLIGLALAAQWMALGRVDRCLVVGAEEVDWIAAEAMRIFDKDRRLSEGAGALLLEPGDHSPVALTAISDEWSCAASGKPRALAAMRAQLSPFDLDSLLCTSVAGGGRLDRAENALWKDWTGPRLSSKTVLGEGLMASAAWQCVAAVDAVAHGAAPSAIVSAAGLHQHALGARFVRRAGSG